ncbi:protein neprosin-like isoform X2 [Coffea arabica]|uniref:Protein neprosin-like isoform X2 n=1 Tax=Coffea arabica TaxID=13443 RepID=A0ABM4VRW3_COFAR
MGTCSSLRRNNRREFSAALVLDPFLLLLLLFFFQLVFFSQRSLADNSASLNVTKYRQVSSLRLARIERHLKKINKPAVYTIESPDGDIIDCVHKRKQPALDHPLLKNHKIQRVPPEMPKAKMMKTDGVRDTNTSSSGTRGRAWQYWHHSGQRCPKGTVPIRRSSVNDVLRAKSLYDFGKKQRKMSLARQADAPDVVSGNGHEHAIAYTGTSQEVYGAKATINVWDPTIQVVNEFSLSQIWVLSGSFDGSDLNSIEAGWQVSPELYGDSRPRLFTYWTDPKLGNWWMGFGDNTLVGYWPTELFTHLADRATMVEWGGEVVNSRPNGEHTSTQMGSGHFADEGFGKASYFRNLEVVDSDNSLSSAQAISTLAENSNCYNIRSSNNNEWGTNFYYGGPGRNSLCY